MNLLSKDEKAIKFGLPGNLNPMYGRTHSQETKNIISHKRLGSSPINKGKSLEDSVGSKRASEIRKLLSDKAKARTGDKNPFYNKSHSDKTKKHLSETMKGRKPSNMKKVIIDDLIFESVTEASRQLNVSPATILFRIKSKSDNFRSYKYVE